MQFQLLFLSLAPALVSAWSLNWYSGKDCTGPLGRIDSANSHITSGTFDSGVHAAIAQDSGDKITIDQQLIKDGACVEVVHRKANVPWAYWG